MNRKTFLGLIGAFTSTSVLGSLCRARAAEEISAPRSPWDAVNFQCDLQSKTLPGVAIRLPDRSLYVACRICPHQGCTFNYETNFKAVGNIVGKDFENPILFCRCHMSVFDPAQKGQVLNGPAPRPPWLIYANESVGRLTILSAEKGVGDIN
jgi:nitrite reductase/ring-hydroxylating ferredoxin subunit